MKSVRSKIKKLKKYHKWPGLIISFFLLYYAVTGLMMNHREIISGIDINRSVLPKSYNYVNWNQAAIKGSEIISKDSILIYGNIGVWLTDSTFRKFDDFNMGFPKGIDNRKIFDIHLSDNNNLFAATLYGLYAFNKENGNWQKITINTDIDRFVAVISKQDTIIAMNRSYIFKGLDNGCNTIFEKVQLKAPKNYKNEIGLFETIWQIHSGEIFGLPGQLFIDFMGFLFIILSITGIIYFFFPKLIKYRKHKEKKVSTLVSTNKWSLKWHNKIGAWFILFLIITPLTGMFLRPPFLLLVANSKIPALKFTHLDQPNPWYDDLRNIIYDNDKNAYILASYNGLYELKSLSSIPSLFDVQPPISVMGINVLERFNSNSYLIGSFSGLFLWSPNQNEIYDFITGQSYHDVSTGRPFGNYAISGIIKDSKENLYFVDYNEGVFGLNQNAIFPSMPEEVIEKAPISLWNLALEIHTGRIFQFIFKDFYILIVPLAGIVSLIVIISGYLLWRRKKKNS